MKTEGDKILSANLFPVVGIGASAGGLNAFKKLLSAITEDSGMAYVLVQHLDPNHESMLPEILQKVTRIPVLEITDDIKVHPDHIYVIPSNKMMVATDGILVLTPRPEKNKAERNLPIDLFFASLAEVHQEHAIGVVLSGTASDGTQGLKAIKEHGGITFAQDEASAEYEGMPQSAAQAGVVDFILPPEDIPKKLLEVTQKTVLTDEALQNIPKQDEDVFKQILSLLRIRKGVDFTYYKQTTIRRRILRRMVVNKNEDPEEYLKFLRGSTAEQDLLYQDMLIPVTTFFRDKKTFDNLCKDVFPSILKNKIPGEITRIWIAGCSTGQEAYSFAICLKEFLGDDNERIQIFGSDLSEPAIIKARIGYYEKAELDNVSPERLKEYFTKYNGGYQVNKTIRDMCVFAHHNFLKDPPFGKMDCISCRNVLIYMEPYLQKKALTTFHYALNPKGFLLLGKSETTGGVPDLFASASKTDKLYTRKDAPGRFMQVTSQRSEQNLSRTTENSKNEPIRTDFQKTADDILLTKYTPAGVVVNESLDIVHFRGNTSNYLQQAPGKPSHNLLMLAKYGLGFELRNILHKAKTDQVVVVKENIPLQVNDVLRTISIEAVPLPNMLEPYYLVLFHDSNLNDADGVVTSKKRKVSAKAKQDEKDIRIQVLEQELGQLREDMRSITEEQEANNEELQSANEELLSGSEELQSLNEELETSKEELQSTNEELTVLNHELIGLNEQVTDSRNYSESIVATLYQPLLVLDKNLRVKTANKAFYETFRVKEQETEGVLVYDLGNRQWNIPELRILLEEILPQKKQITDFEVTHNFTSIGQRIILLSALELTREKKEEKLILLSIEDITERKEAAKKIEENEKHLQNIFTSAPAAIAVLEGPELKYTLANPRYQEIANRNEEQLLGKSLKDVFSEPDNAGAFLSFYNAFKSGETFAAPEFAVLLDKNNDGVLSQFVYNLTIEPLKDADGNTHSLMVIAYDITDQVEARKTIEESEKKYRLLFTSIDQGLSLCELIRNKEGKGIDLYIREVNPTYEEQTGVKREMVIDKPLLQVFPSLEKLMATYAAVVDNQEPVEFEQYFEDTERWFSINAYPVEKEKFAVLFSNITERKQVEEKLKESENRFRTMADASPVLIWTLDAKGLSSYYNKTFLDFLGVPKDANISDWKPIVHPDDVELTSNIINKAIAEHIPYILELRLLRSDGDWRWVLAQGNPNIGVNNEFLGFVGSSFDITERKQAEEKIKESEVKFRTLIEDAPVATCLFTGREMKIEIANDKMLAYLGKEKDVIGKPLADAVPELIGQPFLQLLADVFTTGKVHEGKNEVAQLMVDGVLGTYYFDYTYKPIRNVVGEVYGIMNMAIDVTEQVLARKKIEESEKQFRQMAELMPQKIWTSDAEGNKDYFNQTLLDYVGFTFDELKGSGWQQIVHPDDWGKNKDQWEKCISTGKDYETENRLLRKDGEYLWHLTRAVALKDETGKIKMWIGSKTEIQEQKEQKEILENFVNERTNELQQANKELEEKNNEYEKVNKELEAFSYIASHDLQEPLRKIRTFTSRIYEKESEGLTDKGKEYFKRIQTSAARMQQLIIDLLAFSRLNMADWIFETTGLNSIIEDIKLELKETIEEKHATIEATELCDIYVIPFQFRQLMQNLIGNALKFSKPGVPPHITIKSKIADGAQFLKEKNDLRVGNLSPEKKYCCITVSDNGIGFNIRYKDHVFELFQRLHGKDEYSGTGIGLSIVKKIVENHMGFILVASEPGIGTSFDIYIPHIM